MDTFVNPLKNTVRNVGNAVKSMPDNFVDGVAKMSGGIKSIPTNMLDGVGKMLNVKGVCMPHISLRQHSLMLLMFVYCYLANVF